MGCSIKRASNEMIAANREQLWTATLKGRATKGLQLIKSEQQKDCIRLKSVSNGRIASSKVKHGQNCMYCI